MTATGAAGSVPATSPRSSALASAWIELHPATSPSPRFAALMTFDPESGRFLLFGGWGGPYGGTALNDTWSYEPSTNVWTNRTPATHPGLADYEPGSAALVYDSRSDRAILFGGCSTPHCSNPNETWAYDVGANLWTKMHPAVSPNASHDFGLVYDSGADRVLLLGGASLAPHYFYNVVNGLWAYDYATDSWAIRSPSASPPARLGQGMVYDSLAARTIVFGGCTDAVLLWPSCRMVNDTWAYDFARHGWTNRSPVSSPPPGVNLPMAYDGLADRAVLFGEGWAGGNATWAYDYAANAWSELDLTASPTARSRPGMASDPSAGRILLFGGAHEAFLGDTWSFSSSGSPGGGIQSADAIVWVVGIGMLAAGVAAIAAVVVWIGRPKRGAPPGPP